MVKNMGKTEMRRITVKEIKAIKQPGRYRADPTLYLNVAPGGSKSWVQRIFIKGKQRDIGLGGFPLITLVEAREIAFENRRRARRGDVIQTPAEKRDEARNATTVPTFREAAISTHAAKLPTWKNAKVAANWLQQLERHAQGQLGDMPVDQIGRNDILQVLTPIWTTKPETARRVRRAIKTTLQWALAKDYVEQNLAGEAIDGALPKMRAVKEHFRALGYREVPEALDTIESARGSSASGSCLRFTILTAVRSGEARNAAWSEFDLEARTWKIPSERMKTGVEHRVPLSDAAMAVLEQARRLGNGRGLVFPSPNRLGQPLSDMTLTRVLRDTGLAKRATVHGFRSSFRDWCAETGKPQELAEAALAHVVGGVEGAYFRSDLFDARRRLMDSWAAFLTGEAAKVITLHADKSA